MVDTIEFHHEHIEEAKKNITEWGGDIGRVTFFEGDARDILEAPPLGEGFGERVYDVIFFDGYGVKLEFYKDFERLLKSNGLLIVANQHLKSTEPEFFKELENTNLWEFLKEFADTRVYKKL
jgi:predicted O-methyltransferase YrrM